VSLDLRAQNAALRSAMDRLLLANAELADKVNAAAAASAQAPALPSPGAATRWPSFSEVARGGVREGAGVCCLALRRAGRAGWAGLGWDTPATA
jgi:hypothetical protein